MIAKRLVTIAICIQFVCVAIDLFYLDAIFRWIADSTYLGKNKYPEVDKIVGVSMMAATIIGSILFLASLVWGTTLQRVVCIFPGVVLLWFLWFIIRGVVLYGF
jgi:hypothetical protein